MNWIELFKVLAPIIMQVITEISKASKPGLVPAPERKVPKKIAAALQKAVNQINDAG